MPCRSRPSSVGRKRCAGQQEYRDEGNAVQVDDSAHRGFAPDAGIHEAVRRRGESLSMGLKGRSRWKERVVGWVAAKARIALGQQGRGAYPHDRQPVRVLVGRTQGPGLLRAPHPRVRRDGHRSPASKLDLQTNFEPADQAA